VGVLLRGAEETRFSLVHLVHSQHANLSQLFVRENTSLPVRCDVFVSESDSLEMRGSIHFRQAEQNCRAAPGYIFEFLCFMVAPSRRK